MSSSNEPTREDAISRVLFICPKVRIYAVPPITSNRGYIASQWTERPEIFMARVRIIETATPAPRQSSTSSQVANETIAVAIMLEDPASGELFAAAPYTHPSVSTPCTDSTRFFAVRVVGEGGMKATLGVGFEERSDAFDFGIALQGAGRVLGFAQGDAAKGVAAKNIEGAKRDLSLKEGEMVKVNVGRRRAVKGHGGGSSNGSSEAMTQTDGTLLPPPSAADVRKRMNRLEETVDTPTGFDDGEFGEFQ